MSARVDVLRRLGLAALAGGLYFLGFTSFGTRVTALVCLVPLLWAVRGVDSGRRALAIGWAFGLAMNLFGYYWLIYTFRMFGGFGPAVGVPLYVLFAAYQAGQLALFVWLVHRFRRRGVGTVVAAPVALVAAEKLFPMLFPSYLGAALHELPVALQTAELGGPTVVSALAAVANAVLFELSVAAFTGAPVRRRPTLAGAAVVAVALGYGAVRMVQVDRRTETAPRLKLGLVQASIGILERAADPGAAHRQHVVQTMALTRDHDDLDLIVWPESGFPFALPDRVTNLRGAVTGPNATTPVLFGGGRVDDHGRYYNTAFLADRDGQVLARYDKTYLLAFGEYMPLGDRFPRLYELSPGTAHLTRGERIVPFELANARLAVLICYEDLLPGFTRRVVREAAPQLLVNLTNDAWFGDSLEPWLHLALARLRAVEHRRYLVRATNTGVSAVIDPAGRVTLASGVFTRESLVAEVRLLDGRTVFAHVGDWPGWTAVVLAVWLGLARRLQSTNANRGAGPPPGGIIAP